MTSRSFLRLPLFASGLLGIAALAQSQQQPAAPTTAPAAAPTTAPAATAAAPSIYKTNREKAGYAIGAKVGRDLTTLKEQGIDADPATIITAVTDALTGTPMKMSDREIQETLTAIQTDNQNRQTAKMKTTGDSNKKEGEAFLAANKTKDGVKTTATGLQYKVIKEGTGPMPKATDTVSAHYRGTLINGKEFDSSYKRNEPLKFPVTRVIPGWTEALQLMKVGSKYQLFVPSNLAYAENGAGPDIGPNTTLIFDVELLGIEGQK